MLLLNLVESYHNGAHVLSLTSPLVPEDLLVDEFLRLPLNQGINIAQAFWGTLSTTTRALEKEAALVKHPLISKAVFASKLQASLPAGTETLENIRAKESFLGVENGSHALVAPLVLEIRAHCKETGRL